MFLARYVSTYDVSVAVDPIYYDLASKIRYDSIVGWVVWYEDGARYCSLDTSPEQLPPRGVQVMRVWYTRDDGKEGFWSATYTRDEYPVPGSEVIVRGDWTDMLNHDQIFALAIKDCSWPPIGW